MVLRKGKKNLSSIFRSAMKNAAKKSSNAANTAEAKAGNSPDMEVTESVSLISLPEILSPLKSCGDSFNTGKSFSETALADQVSSGFNVKATDSNFLPERNEHKVFSKKSLEMTAFLAEKLSSPPRTNQLSRSGILTDHFKKNQSQLMKKLVEGRTQLGTETMLNVLTKLGKEARPKEYNARIKLCIEKARRSNDAEYVLDQIDKTIELLKEMRQRGFSIRNRTYRHFCRYLIDMEMVEEFQIFKDFIREACPESLGKLVYYEMLLWLQVNDEKKIHEVCNTNDDNGKSLSTLQEYYLVALCEKDRKEEFQKVLEITDITKVSSPGGLNTIFRYLGKSLLESVALKLLWKLRDCDGVETISNLIFSYATCISYSTVEDVILKFNKLHEELDIVPPSTSYENLVSYLCGSNEVDAALDVVENMCEEGLVISAKILHSLLQAVEQIPEFILVRRIYSIMSNKSVKPNSKTFRRSINLCLRIKDFEGAYKMLGSLKNFNLAPESSMYNSILVGYFREKKVNKALMVLKEMKQADVKPDSMTYSYLINNCCQEEAIAEYNEEMKQSGVPANKHVYMSLIKAYASCGQFEKAKHVLMDLEVLAKDRNELKSVLVSALASNGEITDALSLYEEMKKAGCPIDPKAILSLIDYCSSKEELRTLVQLSNELRDHKYWIESFFKVIVFAVRYNKSSSILDLLKQNKNHFSKDDTAVEYWLEEVSRTIAETEPSNVKLGLDLLSFMKEELGLCPSRKYLDFLLQACVNAKDKNTALLVWKEYQFAQLPYNVLNYLRMYQVLIAVGASKSAKEMESKILIDDRDVKCIIKESSVVFTPKLHRFDPLLYEILFRKKADCH